jgi:hypothetical protein
MDRKFGRFFRHAALHWKKPILEKLRQEGVWSLIASIPSYFIMAHWVGINAMIIELRVALSLIGGIAITQIFRFLGLLLIAPFTILKEQDGIISSLEKITDRKSIIGQLSSLWVEGTALRNKGESLMHESRVETWWNDHTEWRNRTKSTIALLDPSKASQWWTLGTYTPRRNIPQAFSPLHEKRIQMFDAWLERLSLLIQEFQKEEDK